LFREGDGSLNRAGAGRVPAFPRRRAVPCRAAGGGNAGAGGLNIIATMGMAQPPQLICTCTCNQMQIHGSQHHTGQDQKLAGRLHAWGPHTGRIKLRASQPWAEDGSRRGSPRLFMSSMPDQGWTQSKYGHQSTIRACRWGRGGSVCPTQTPATREHTRRRGDDAHGVVPQGIMSSWEVIECIIGSTFWPLGPPQERPRVHRRPPNRLNQPDIGQNEGHAQASRLCRSGN